MVIGLVFIEEEGQGAGEDTADTGDGEEESVEGEGKI